MNSADQRVPQLLIWSLVLTRDVRVQIFPQPEKHVFTDSPDFGIKEKKISVQESVLGVQIEECGAIKRTGKN